MIEAEPPAIGKFELCHVLATAELESRPTQAPDFAAENRVLLRLAEKMASSEPQAILQSLADGALELCGADSAGVSLLDSESSESGRGQFRWVATAGELGSLAGNTMPRDFSPCGSVLDANSTLLMADPARHFRYIESLPVPICEVLLVPFYHREVAVGTVWVVAHTPATRFNAEHARTVKSLCQFAAAAVQLLEGARARSKQQEAERNLAEKDLAALTEINRLLKDTDRDKAQLLMKLAHEFRNTLSPILYAMEIQKRDADAPAQARSRRVMERQIAHLARLVDDLTDFSQISSGRLRLQKKTTDLNRVLQEAVESARGLLSASGQTVALQLAPDPVACECDELRLAQVFGNLLTNAAKYGKPDGRVEVQLARQPGAAVICVRDAGIGIEAQMLPRVFDLFVQADDALARSGGGLGIGLAIVRQLIALHGGSVEARSDGLGSGSQFIVRLPIP